MNINLRIEAINRYVSLYQNYLEDTQRLNVRVMEVFNLVMQRSRYDKLQILISNMIDVYMETILNNIENSLFASWELSNASLRACLRLYHAGAEADAVCALVEQRMNRLMIDILKIEKENWIPAEHPIISGDGLELLEDICRKAQTNITALTQRYLAKVDAETADNDIFGTLRPLIAGISSNLEALFGTFLQRFAQLHEFVRENAQRLRNITEESTAASGYDASSGGSSLSVSITVESTAGSSVAASSGNHRPAKASSKPDVKVEISFEGENFTEENIRRFVAIAEQIVAQVGTEELNRLVDTHHSSLTHLHTVCSRRTSAGTSQTSSRQANQYGRYTVTEHSIRQTAPLYAQADAILKPLDKFYKDKFSSLENGLNKVNSVIHALSSFMGLWGLGTWNLAKLFSTEDDGNNISWSDRIQLGGLALASCSKAGLAIMGGAHMLKILDWAMPYMKKSKTLVKLNEKFWGLTRQDIQMPYVQRMMDQYMMEHYEKKYGMNNWKSPMFEFYHEAVSTIGDDNQRRAFENSIFSAETLFTPQNYIIMETDPFKYRAICCGVFLNLVRSGMCSAEDIDAGTSNGIVDKLYHVYSTKESVIPRVDIDPGKNKIG